MLLLGGLARAKSSPELQPILIGSMNGERTKDMLQLITENIHPLKKEQREELRTKLTILVTKYQEGDESVLGKIYELTWNLMAYYAYAAEGYHVEDAEDLLDEAWAKKIQPALKNEPHYPQYYGTWVYSIIMHLNKDRWRNSHRMVPVSQCSYRCYENQEEISDEEFLSRNSDSLEHGLDDKLEQQELHNKLREVLDHLSPEKEEVINLSQEGYKGREIADAFGICENTEKSRKRTGLEDLRKIVKSDNYFKDDDQTR